MNQPIPALACPICHRLVGQMQLERHYVERWPVEQMWPGGPLIPLYDRVPDKMLSHSVINLKPCGDTLVWAANEPPPDFQLYQKGNPTP